MYIDNQSVKLDKAVTFPLEGLDLREFLSGPLHSDADDQTTFDLYAVANHFGTATGGHYTAYARHVAAGGWNELDDGFPKPGTAPRGHPRDEESAYVLFYQRRGEQSS